MNKRIFLAIFAGLVAVCGSLSWYYFHTNPIVTSTEKDNDKTVAKNEIPLIPENGTYKIEDGVFELKKGVAEAESVFGPGTKVVVRLFGSPYMVDLDNDEISEAVVFLQQETGGSGTFYYIAVAKKNSQDAGYVSDSAEFIGDRISPQSIEVKSGEIVVKYNDRKSDESFVVEPSVETFKYYNFLSGKLVEKTIVKPVQPVQNDIENKCTVEGGKWLSDSKECEGGFTEAKCQTLGGEFNSCASACRNDKTAEICTMQCVLVCKFK